MEDGNSVYDLEFYANDKEFEYEINANTGKIYSKSSELRVQRPTDSTKATKAPAVQNEVETTPESVSENKTHNNSQNENNLQNKTEDKNQSKPQNNSENKPQNNTNDKVSLAKAKSIALADAGVSESNATFTKAKPDYDDGILVYDIEFYTSSYEYDYEINAKTGAVRSRESEPLKKAEKPNTNNGNTSGNSKYIGLDKAKSIAVGHAGFSV